MLPDEWLLPLLLLLMLLLVTAAEGSFGRSIKDGAWFLRSGATDQVVAGDGAVTLAVGLQAGVHS